jgi:hypothetical protein
MHNVSGDPSDGPFRAQASPSVCLPGRLAAEPRQQEPSEHGQLSSDQIAMFGTLVRDALMPTEWPDAVALDETSFDVVVTDITPNGKVSQPGTVSVLGVYGYASGRGSGRAITLAPRGGADKVEWGAVLRSREKEPAWVACDQGKAVMSAVKAVWPNATIYVCEAHLRMLGEQRLAADGFDRHHPLWASLRHATAVRWAGAVLTVAGVAAHAASSVVPSTNPSPRPARWTSAAMTVSS